MGNPFRCYYLQPFHLIWHDNQIDDSMFYYWLVGDTCPDRSVSERQHRIGIVTYLQKITNHRLASTYQQRKIADYLSPIIYPLKKMANHLETIIDHRPKMIYHQRKIIYHLPATIYHQRKKAYHRSEITQPLPAVIQPHRKIT